MSSCNGCYNGCVDITSDQCVKYTGSAIAALEIDNGDPLSTVIAQISTYLTSVMTGEGVIPVIDNADLCALVSGYLPSEGDITLNDVISALIQAACDLQSQVDDVVADVAVIEANYTVGCLSGVSAGSGTHAILQAVIVKLCQAVLDITALQTALSAYVPIADIDDYIADYLASQVSTKHYNKMVPYTVVEYYGDLGNFGPSGEGVGDWEQIYLCDGRNGTPDKRGRVPVGANMMSCAPYASADTNIATPGNPNYDIFDTAGKNNVILTVANLAAHNHAVPAPTVTDPGHRHIFGGDRTAITPMGFEKYNDVATGYDVNADGPPNIDYGAIPFYTKSSSNQVAQNFQTTGISVSVPDTSNKGNSQAHENRPPVIACYYIMFIPTP